jgi:hypothetical protein
MAGTERLAKVAAREGAAAASKQSGASHPRQSWRAQRCMPLYDCPLAAVGRAGVGVLLERRPCPVRSLTHAACSYVVPQDARDHLNVVFIGHVDAGKSTLGGQILFVTDQVCVCGGGEESRRQGDDMSSLCMQLQPRWGGGEDSGNDS